MTTIDVLPWIAVPSPTADLVAIGPHTAARDQSLKLWDTVTGQPVATLAGHTGAVYDVAFSADGTRLATAGADGTIRLWDPTSGAHVLTLDGHIGAIVWSRSTLRARSSPRLAWTAPSGSGRSTSTNWSKSPSARVTRGFTEDECVRYLQRQSCGG